MTAIKATTTKHFSISYKTFCGMCALTLLGSVLWVALKAQETLGKPSGLIPNGDTAQGNINAGEAASNTGQSEHPLEPALALAAKGLNNLRANIKDYSCTVVKRERIGGELKPHEYMFAKIGHEPFSVYLLPCPRSGKGTGSHLL